MAQNKAVEAIRANPGKAATAAGLAAALALATPLVVKWEGTSTKPYRDPIGIWTVCTGETRVEMREYSRAQCASMLNEALRKDYGPAVLRCTPSIADNPAILAAAMSFTYNLGAGNYCKSTIARRFNAGDFKGGCEAFTIKVWSDRERRMVVGWAQAGGREMRGLVNRRKDEQLLCLSGVNVGHA